MKKFNQTPFLPSSEPTIPYFVHIRDPHNRKSVHFRRIFVVGLFPVSLRFIVLGRRAQI